METLKIGLVGAYFANFDAMRLGVYQNACAELSKLGDQLGFELLAYPDGVQTQEEAATAAAWIAAADVDFLLVQCSSFSLGDLIVPLAALDVRLGLWFLPEPALEGQIPLNSFTGFNLFVSIIRTHLGQASRPLKWFYGNTGDTLFRCRLAVSVAALKALKALAGATIGLVGAPAPSFLNLAHDGSALMRRLGVRVEQVPLDELFARVPGYGAAQVEKALAILTQPARRVETGHTWLEASGRVYLSARDLALDVGCAALALRCWPEFQQHMGGLGPCAAVSWLNEAGLPTSCEGDVPAAISMLAAAAMSGAPATLADLVAVDEGSGAALMWHCGPAPASWADAEGQVLTYHPTLDRASPESAPRSGLSSDLVYAPGAVTVARFSNSAESLFLLSGEVISGPGRGYVGSRGWVGRLKMAGTPLTTHDLIETIAHYGLVHHYPLARGDWANAFAELAAWTGANVLTPITYRDHLVPVARS